MKNTDNKSEAARLRQKAEELLKRKPLKTDSQISEAETLKLIHELDVHQIELELQNEELRLAKEQAEVATEKYIELYDFAPSGYFTLSKEGKIIELNLCGSQMLGKERSRLKNSSFGFFVSDDTKPIFNLFLGKVFDNIVKESCEVTLSSDGNLPIYVHVAGIVAGNGEYCHVTAIDITERKRAEENLRKSEERFRALIESSMDVTTIVDAKGTILYHSPNYANVWGQDPSDRIGKDMFKDIYPDDIPLVGDSFVRLLKNPKETVQMVVRALHTDGTWRTLEIVAHNHLENPALRGIVVNFQDITQRKKAEEKLTSIFSAAPVGIGLIVNSILVEVNDTFCKMTGYSREELIGTKGKIIFPATEEYEFVKSESNRQISERGSVALETKLKSKNGSILNILLSTAPLDKDNLSKGLTFTAMDITESKQAEIALRKSEEKYRGIFENVHDLFYETSIEGTILEVSPSIKILSKGQYKRDDLIGKSMYEFYSDPMRRETLLNVLREHGFVSDFEITLKNRDGSNIPCSISGKIIFDVHGRPEKIIGTMRDITDRNIASDALRLAKEKAEANDKLKTTFLNNISHEVRTPLNGVLGFAEIVCQTNLSEEEKKVSLSMLFESSDRLLNTITNYMDISLITSGNISVHKKDFIPGQILRNIFDKYKTMCSNRRLELFLKIPEQTDNLSINSDPEIFQKIISHLLNNAIKFTEKGSISYGYIIHERELEFFVKDTGIGIGKESIGNIFNHFVKEDRGTSKLSEGSGLGLSIAKGMIEIIGGNIRVESEIGVGSCFFFTIPLTKDTEITLSDTTSKERKKITGGASILIAEDDEINFFFLKTLLTRETGAKVLHASNGKEAIKKLKENPDIGLVLMDIKMPVMNGLEATKQIKSIKKDVPVIAITAYAMLGDEEKILAAGCDNYISKPINKKKLLEIINSYLRNTKGR